MIKVITRCVLNIETLRWIPELEESYFYDGPIAECLGGASKGAKGLNVDEDEFMQSLQNEQSTQFANEQDAQNQIQKAWSPIVAGGPYQYGFSTAEDQAIRGDIVNQGATATTNSENAALLREQQDSGGASSMPAGGQAALNAQIAATGAQSTAAQLGQEKEAGYAQGSKLFSEGTAAEESVAQLANPTGYAGATSDAAKNANSMQQYVDAQNANSLTNKLLGGAINAGLDFATMGASSLMGAAIPGLTGGGGGIGGGGGDFGPAGSTSPIPSDYGGKG